MNFPSDIVDLTSLRPYEEAFVSASQKHLGEMHRLRRLARRA
jgi:hypothetical protein